MVFNITISSVFYGTLFACAGIVPFITFPLISIYGFNEYNKNNKKEKEKEKEKENKENDKL